ncbi:MAG: hypothetical protein EOM50_05525 [Erysipelotrichia bacterium]|nr:hypothetical protein [Erysipelotrichia bacterium]NCC55045.1 hypothetical protein [Erysipelotrichia bacterium]
MKTKLTKKSVSLIILVVALFAGIFAVNSAWSYFTANDKESNKITLRAVDTEIEEEINDSDLTKIPVVRNTGSDDCIVRLKFSVTPEKERENIELRGLNTTDWLYNKEDGYYYYQGVLAPKAATPAIFTGVNITNMKAMNNFDIMLYQEAIQPEIIDHDGNKVDVLSEGKYNQSKADIIWKLYESQS